MKMVLFVLLKMLSVVVGGKVVDGKDNPYIANNNTNTSQTLAENVMKTMEFRVSLTWNCNILVSALLIVSPYILYIEFHVKKALIFQTVKAEDHFKI